MSAKITCIANPGNDGAKEVPLWECPCRECTKLDWEALDDERPSLAAWRHDGFPAHWTPTGKSTRR